ncbi:MAG: hypothetical protein ABI193_03435 [Minicystis sp.]
MNLGQIVEDEREQLGLAEVPEQAADEVLVGAVDPEPGLARGGEGSSFQVELPAALAPR